MEKIENLLKTSAHRWATGDPFMALLLILTFYSDFIYQDAGNLGHQAAILERTTGLGSFAYSALPDINVEDLKTKHMSWIIGNLRVANGAVGFQTELIAFIQASHLKMLSHNVSETLSIDSLRNLSRDIHEALQALRNSMEWKLKGVRTGQERAQALHEGVSKSPFKACNPMYGNERADHSGKIGSDVNQRRR